MNRYFTKPFDFPINDKIIFFHRNTWLLFYLYNFIDSSYNDFTINSGEAKEKYTLS